jgi:hypothetical protein
MKETSKMADIVIQLYDDQDNGWNGFGQSEYAEMQDALDATAADAEKNPGKIYLITEIIDAGTPNEDWQPRYVFLKGKRFNLIPPKWRLMLGERDRKEVAFSQHYAKEFRHGTMGHSAHLLIDALAVILDGEGQ